MTLTLYNTLTRQKDVFTPIEPGTVKMYVCGVTVYDVCHLGHARVMIVFDVVSRWLKHIGYTVHYVRNITDIDDKIIHRAKERGIVIQELTKEFIDAMHQDEAALGVERPNLEPLATDSINKMIDMIHSLICKGLAYVGQQGDVLYSVSQFEHYGCLSGKQLNTLRAGERVDIDTAKQDPLDFVLWKRSKPDEPYWDSPWGKGRPGWHIECSAMSMQFLGEQFDIHGGGLDLQFPHHENEIAQSHGVTGKMPARYWMHNGFVRVDEEKMSKSLGNFFTIREVMKRFRPEVIRFFMLNSHYRSPLNYSTQQLENAEAGLIRLYRTLEKDHSFGASNKNDKRDVPSDDAHHRAYCQRFYDAMNDDFNTPEAIAVLFDLAREINRSQTENAENANYLAIHLKELGGILGLLQCDPKEFLRVSYTQTLPFSHVVSDREAMSFTYERTADEEKLVQQRSAAIVRQDWQEAVCLWEKLKEQGIVLPLEEGQKGGEITWLIQQRLEARKKRDWKEADRIRSLLKEQHILLEDGASETTWRLAR